MKELELLALDILRKTSECVYLLSYQPNDGFTLLDANEVFEETFCENIKCKGKNLESFTDYATAKRLETLCKACLNNDDIKKEKIPVSTKSGVQNHECTFYQISKTNSEVRILCTHRILCDDPSARKENFQLSKFLNQSEKASFMGHFIAYPQRRNVVFSESFQQLLGINRVEMSFKEAISLLLPEEISTIYAKFEQATKEQSVFYTRHTLVEPGGRKRDVISRGDLLFDEHNQLKEFWCQVQELTNVNELRNESRSIQSRMRALTSAAPFGYIVVDGETPVFINQTIFEWTNTRFSRKIYNINPMSWIHPSDRKSLLKLLRKLMRKESHDTYTMTVRNNAPRDLMRTYDLFIVVLPNGPEYQINILVVDITEDLEKEKYKHQLAFSSMLMVQKNEDMQDVRRMLEQVLTEKKLNRGDFAKILHSLESKSNSELDWSLFNNHIENLCPDFVKNLRIIYPGLSASDIKHCACIRLNFDTKETAAFFHVTPSSIQTARVRLKKKMGLSDRIDLRDFIFNI